MVIIESIGVAALGWVASPLVGKLLNEGFESLGINAEEKLQELSDTVLPVLNSVIEKAEGSEHRKKVENWLQRLKDAYDDAEDALDLLNYWRLEREAANRVRLFRVPKPPKLIMPILKGGRDMISLRKIKLKRKLNKLEKIAREALKLRDLLGAQTDQTAAVPDNRQTISVPPRKVFGRDKDRDEIIRRLKIEPTTIRDPVSSSMPSIAIRDPGSSSIPTIAIREQGSSSMPTIAICDPGSSSMPTIAIRDPGSSSIPTIAVRDPGSSSIPTIAIRDLGSSSMPTIAIRDPGSSSMPTIAIRDPGSSSIPSIAIRDPGSSSIPPIAICEPGSSSMPAIAIREPRSSSMPAIAIRHPGSSSLPAIAICDQESSSMPAIAIRNPRSSSMPAIAIRDSRSSTMHTIAIRDPGSSSMPAIAIRDPGSSSMPAIVIRDPESSSIPTIAIRDPGSSSMPTIAIRDPGSSSMPTIVRNSGSSSMPVIAIRDPGSSSMPAIAIRDPGSSSMPAIAIRDPGSSSMSIIAICEPGSSSMPIIAIREPGPSGIPIIAIVGRPGVGKTTIAQYVYNKLEGEGCDRHFDLLMWVYASHNFNISEIIKKIIQQASIASEPQYPVNPDDLLRMVLSHLPNLDTMAVGNLDSLQGLQLKMNKKLNAKKFLLVIDDVWCDREDHKINWDTLFRCLSNFCSPGSKILVTSQTDDAPRKIVAAKSATLEYIHNLKELEENDFLDLFIHHALPSVEIDSSLRKDLKEECKTIAKKLNKDPTAAKMVGGTIALKLAGLHSRGDWRTYLRTIAEKDWTGDKTQALMWSYQHLPAHLQRCFSYCSMYPRGYKFQALELVQFWMAQGFIKPDDQDTRMEDVGNDYLEMLVSRFYIQSHDSYYTLHELLCDLAEKVSHNDCVRIKSNGQSKITSTIRHLCIPANKLKEKKEEICELKKLRTLIVTKGEKVISEESNTSEESDTSEENVATYIFNSFKKLRVLFLELNLENSAEFIGEMKHLRVLRVFGTSKFVLPESVCTLYLLQVLKVGNPSSLPKHLDNLVSLRYLEANFDNISAIPDIGKLTSLQCLEKILVSKEKGNELEQLRNLNELRGCLRIDNLENVKSKESAIAANLKEKKHLAELELVWHDGEDNVNSNLDVEILEGLQLPPNLAELYLKGYRGQLWPSWPKSQTSNIEELELWLCKMLEELSPMDQLYPSCRKLKLLDLPKLKALHTLPPRLRKINIVGTPFLTFATNEDLQVSPAEKRSIIEVMKKSKPEWFLHQHQKSLVDNEKEMRNFIAAMNDSNNEASSSAEHNMSVPADDMDITAAWERWLGTYEQKMELIYNIQNEAKLLLPSTLTELYLKGCNITNHALSACLQTLTSLTDLSLREIQTITCLPSEDVLGNLKALQYLSIWNSWALTSLGGIRSLPRLTELSLENCPCLVSETAFLPSSLEIITFKSCADVDVILPNADLPRVSRLEITRCHMRTASVDLQKLRSLELLELWECSNLEEVMNFPKSLKHLRISGCPILERSINIDPSSGVLLLGGIPVEDLSGRPLIGEFELRRILLSHEVYAITSSAHHHSLPCNF